MSDNDHKFELAASFVQQKNPSVKLDTATQLRFYALYKIATDGPCPVNSTAPSRLNVVAFKKYTAYKNATKDVETKNQAKALYLQELDSKVPNWNQAKL